MVQAVLVAALTVAEEPGETQSMNGIIGLVTKPAKLKHYPPGSVVDLDQKDFDDYLRSGFVREADEADVANARALGKAVPAVPVPDDKGIVRATRQTAEFAQHVEAETRRTGVAEEELDFDDPEPDAAEDAPVPHPAVRRGRPRKSR